MKKLWTVLAAVAVATLGMATPAMADSRPTPVSLADIEKNAARPGAGINASYYEIHNVNSGKCTDVEGYSTADRANIYQFTCRGTTNQHWYFVQVSTGVYEIRAQHSNKCADVEGYSTADRANIYQFTCRGTNNQFWYLTNA